MAHRGWLVTIVSSLIVSLAAGCAPTRPPAASTPTPAATATPVPTATATAMSTPADSWTIAPPLAPTDWDVYITGDYVSDVVPDGDVLWVASSGGLLRWERPSRRLTQYLAPALPLPSNYLDELVLHQGKLYISGHGGLTVFDRQSTWTRYTSEDIGLQVDYVAPIAMVGDVLWLAGEGGLARLYPDGHWEVTRAGQEGLPEQRIEKIVAREDGVCIVVALGDETEDERRGFRYSGGRWESVDPLPLRCPATPDGALWMGGGDGLYRSLDQGDTWKRVLATGPWPSLRAVDAQGRLYVAADDSALVLDGSRVVETYRFADVGPELSYANIMQWDGRGRMWVATDGRGMSMFDGTRWRNWQPENSAIREDAIRGLAIGSDRLYAGTCSGAGSGGVNVFDFDSERWTNWWPGESELSGGGVEGIAIDAQGRVFMPTAEGILDIYDGQRWQHVPMPLSEHTILVTSEGLFDAAGNYWVGTGLGLWMYDGEKWTIYGIPVNALAEDAEGRLWAGTTQGLVVRDLDGRWLVYTAQELPVGNGWIQDIAIDPQGRVWMISYNALAVFNGESYQAFSPDAVGAILWGSAVAVDPEGRVWVGTDDGIAMLKGQPAIPGFKALTLPPAQTLSERDIVLAPGELDRLRPQPPAGSPVLSRSLLVGVLLALLLCLSAVVAAGAVVVYLVLRRRKARPARRRPRRLPRVERVMTVSAAPYWMPPGPRRVEPERDCGAAARGCDVRCQDEGGGLAPAGRPDSARAQVSEGSP